MNFHALVRPLISNVNPDVLGVWRQYLGFTEGADGRPVPSYTNIPSLRMQVQAQTGETLKHPNNVSQQGVRRDVYMYGNVQAINRPDAKGADLLQFAEVPGGSVKVWLVTEVYETWPDWCKVGVMLQMDTPV